MLVIRRIHVTYNLKLEPDKRETAERIFGFHTDSCPVARTLRGCVEIKTSIEMEDV